MFCSQRGETARPAQGVGGSVKRWVNMGMGRRSRAAPRSGAAPLRLVIIGAGTLVRRGAARPLAGGARG